MSKTRFCGYLKLYSVFHEEEEKRVEEEGVGVGGRRKKMEKDTVGYVEKVI